MTGFGDFDDDDAFDAGGRVDPEQVGIKLRRLYAELGDGEHDGVGRRLVAWLIRQGAIR